MRWPFYNKPNLGLPGGWKKLEHLVIPDAALDTLQIGPHLELPTNLCQSLVLSPF